MDRWGGGRLAMKKKGERGGEWVGRQRERGRTDLCHRRRTCEPAWAPGGRRARRRCWVLSVKSRSSKNDTHSLSRDDMQSSSVYACHPTSCPWWHVTDVILAQTLLYFETLMWFKMVSPVWLLFVAVASAQTW